MVIFKIIFALLSAKLADLLGTHPVGGLIVGVFFGHFLDILAYKKFMYLKYKLIYQSKARAQAEADFIMCFFTIAGKICYSDGELSPEELTKIEEIIKTRLKYKRKQKKLALKYFHEANKKQVVIQTLTARIVELMGNEPTSLRNTVYILKELAEADGEVNSQEFKILYTIASVLGMDPQESSKFLKSPKLKAQSKQNTSTKKDAVKTPYEVLGCSKSDSTDKIKRSYRELASKFHPDKVISKELPQDFIDFASQRFKEIHLAYQSVKKERGF